MNSVIALHWGQSKLSSNLFLMELIVQVNIEKVNIDEESDVSWFQYCWFFFELIIKSMAQHLVESDKVKVRWHALPLLPKKIVPSNSFASLSPDLWYSTRLLLVFVFLQLPRPQRFPSSYLSRMETLVETVSEHIFWKNKDLAEETRSANLAVAAFVKVGAKCLQELNNSLSMLCGQKVWANAKVI